MENAKILDVVNTVKGEALNTSLDMYFRVNGKIGNLVTFYNDAETTIYVDDVVNYLMSSTNVIGHYVLECNPVGRICVRAGVEVKFDKSDDTTYEIVYTHSAPYKAFQDEEMMRRYLTSFEDGEFTEVKFYKCSEGKREEVSFNKFILDGFTKYVNTRS